MTYHINNDKNIKACGARRPENCPFRNNTQKFIQEIELDGGIIDKNVFDKKNHYNTLEGAQRVVEAILNANNPLQSKKKKPSTTFTKNRDLIKESLIKYGNIPVENITEVSNVREMVKEWFNGDRNTYNAFKYITENETLNESTRAKIANLVNNNFRVTTVQQVDKIGLKPEPKSRSAATNFDNLQSEITIIDEFSDSITLEDLKSGKVKPFIF